MDQNAGPSHEVTVEGQDPVPVMPDFQLNLSLDENNTNFAVNALSNDKTKNTGTSLYHPIPTPRKSRAKQSIVQSTIIASNANTSRPNANSCDSNVYAKQSDSNFVPVRNCECKFNDKLPKIKMHSFTPTDINCWFSTLEYKFRQNLINCNNHKLTYLIDNLTGFELKIALGNEQKQNAYMATKQMILDLHGLSKERARQSIRNLELNDNSVIGFAIQLDSLNENALYDECDLKDILLKAVPAYVANQFYFLKDCHDLHALAANMQTFMSFNNNQSQAHTSNTFQNTPYVQCNQTNIQNNRQNQNKQSHDPNAHLNSGYCYYHFWYKSNARNCYGPPCKLSSSFKGLFKSQPSNLRSGDLNTPGEQHAL